MKKSFILLTLLSIAILSFAQKKTTTSAIIAFDATTSLDNLPKAENKTVIASLDTKSGAVAFEALIKNFTFSNPRMQDHFNAPNWMDSNQFPTATFKGAITNLKAVNFSKDGIYTAVVEGDLTMHGQTQKVKTNASVVVKGGSISTSTAFSVKLEDYKIDAPPVGSGKVAKDPKVTVSADF